MSIPIASTEAELESDIRTGLPEGVPIVCFANDWNGDPTSKHHVMRTYSRFTDIVWVESAGMRVPNLLALTDARRVLQRIRRSVTPAAPGGDPRVHVVSPLAVPLPGNPVAVAVNTITYRRVVRKALATLGAELPIIWVFQPTVAPYIRDMPRRALVYHCVDRWWAFSDYDTDVMQACHRELCEKADVTFASALALLEDCRAHTDRAELIPHGVDWGHFAKAALEPPARPADIADISGRIIGFFGLLHEWVDQDLLCRIARAYPHATLVLIGAAQVDVKRLEREPNIRLLGRKPYAALPAYSAAFDVALIPFVFSELTLAVNPIKLREYMSAGLPVVASALPEIRALGDKPGLFAAETPDDFIDAVGKALALPADQASRGARARAMAPESWLGRCAQMATSVRARLR